MSCFSKQYRSHRFSYIRLLKKLHYKVLEQNAQSNILLFHSSGLVGSPDSEGGNGNGGQIRRVIRILLGSNALKKTDQFTADIMQSTSRAIQHELAHRPYVFLGFIGFTVFSLSGAKMYFDSDLNKYKANLAVQVKVAEADVKIAEAQAQVQAQVEIAKANAKIAEAQVKIAETKAAAKIEIAKIQAKDAVQK